MSYSKEVFDACRADERVFVLNPRFARANFYAQQVRVLHLLKSMKEENVVDAVSAREVAIVGGGIAGLTAAAGALSLNLGVRVFEPSDGILSKYNQAIHREIHPNIISWPFNDLRAVTNLPFMNWGFSAANKVADRIRTQWNEYISRHARLISASVSSLKYDEDRNSVVITTEDDSEFFTDCAIVTVGFEREVLLSSCASPSYWSPRVFEGKDPVWISGTGDGGLIDVACQTFGVDATKVVRELAYCLDGKPQRDAINYAEESALSRLVSGDEEGSFEELGIFYSKLGIEPEDLAPLQECKIADSATANLVHQRASAYSPLSCPINKVIVSVMAEGTNPEVIMHKGSIEERESADGSERSVVLKGDNEDTAIDVDRFIVRHGAKHAAWSILSDNQKQRLESASSEVLSKPVPDFVLEDWEETFSARTLIPDEWYADNFYGIVCEILATSGDSAARIDRSGSRTHWTVDQGSLSSRSIKSIFPIEMGEFIVSLTDSQPTEFQAL